MEASQLLPHLFRTEYSRITAVLCRAFGAARIQLAEDIAADTFLQATETWGLKGLPDNPKAWLYTVAKNKAADYFRRENTYRNNVEPELKKQAAPHEAPQIDLTEQNITDSMLRMLFAVCHPCISPEAQIGLALRILCGFGLTEIATAFMSNTETINKRLTRARQKLQAENISLELPPDTEISERLEAVLTTVYLLFNEGYFSQGNSHAIRKELCVEAMQLAHLLAQNPVTARPQVHALLALMCFHASRFEARVDPEGLFVPYEEQDSTLWDTTLIARGEHYMNLSATGPVVSRYHLEAGIALWHTRQQDSQDKWEAILMLYNRLLVLEYSPAAALNRTYALARARGNAAALPEALKLGLEGNPHYHTLLGELYTKIDNNQAAHHFNEALNLSKNPSANTIIRKKLRNVEP